MGFAWLACVDGSSIKMSEISAFSVAMVHKHTPEGQPLYEDDEKTKPIQQMIVIATIGARDYPLRPVASMQEAQISIQGLLGKMKKDYDDEHGHVRIATGDEKASLKLG